MRSRNHHQMMIACLFSMIATEVFTERYKFRNTIAVELQTFLHLVPYQFLYILIHFRTVIPRIEFRTLHFKTLVLLLGQ